MKNWKLCQLLQARGLSVTKLARLIGCNHSQVSLTLNNEPGRGYRVRPKLARHLTPEELALVGWDAEGNKLESATVESVPRDTQVPYGTTN